MCLFENDVNVKKKKDIIKSFPKKYIVLKPLKMVFNTAVDMLSALMHECTESS